MLKIFLCLCLIFNFSPVFAEDSSLIQAEKELKAAQEKILATTNTEDYNKAVSEYQVCLKKYENIKSQNLSHDSNSIPPFILENPNLPEQNKGWSLDPQTAKQKNEEKQSQAYIDEMRGFTKEITPDIFGYSMKLGLIENVGVPQEFEGHIGTSIKGRFEGNLGGSFFPTFGSLELMLGHPVIRLFADAQVYPIKIKQYSFKDKNAINVVELAFIPLTAKGKITFQKVKDHRSQIGRSTFVASPDFAVKLLRKEPLNKSAILLSNLDASVGFAGGVVNDEDKGIGSLLGPKIALHGGFTFVIEGNHRIDLETKGQVYFSVLPQVNNVYSTGVSGSFEGEVNYSRLLNEGYAKRWYIGVSGNYESYDVNTKTEDKDAGITAYGGVQGGFLF